MSDQYPTGGAPYAHQTTSTQAIISLITGILGLFMFPIIGSIIAVITGPMAKKEIQASGGVLTGEGLATAGQVIGWTGIGLYGACLCTAGSIVFIPICGGLFLSLFGGLMDMLSPGSSFLLPLLF